MHSFIFSHYRSRSNNDLLGLDKNADTASLHSLPMNSSIPCLDLTAGVPQTASSDNNLGAGLSFDASLTSSPISSPVYDTKGKRDSSPCNFYIMYEFNQRNIRTTNLPYVSKIIL